MINLEDGKSLLARDAGVVGTLSSLDGVGGLGSYTGPISLMRKDY